MGNKLSLQDRVSNAEKTLVLNLSDAGLQNIPIQVLVIKQLRSLDLSNNRLDYLPIECSKVLIGFFLTLLVPPVLLNSLTKTPSGRIKMINLAQNHFSKVPLDLSKLTKVEILNLSTNALAALPAELTLLAGLKTLNLSNNRLKTLPDEIGQLKSLVTLDISGNSISIIPASIASCKSLEELNANKNTIQELPDTLGSLPELKAIRLCNNNLQSFPTTILKNSRVVWIEIAGNPDFDDAKLRELDGYNEFEVRRKDKIITREK